MTEWQNLWKDKMEKSETELRIYNQEDRLNVAQILIKNGYAVRQTKRKRTETGKTLDYYLVVSECDETADTSR